MARGPSTLCFGGSLTENAFGATAHVPKHGPAGWRRVGQQITRGDREIAALHSAQGAYLAPSRPAFGLRSKKCTEALHFSGRGPEVEQLIKKQDVVWARVVCSASF